MIQEYSALQVGNAQEASNLRLILVQLYISKALLQESLFFLVSLCSGWPYSLGKYRFFFSWALQSFLTSSLAEKEQKEGVERTVASFLYSRYVGKVYETSSGCFPLQGYLKILVHRSFQVTFFLG